MAFPAARKLVTPRRRNCVAAVCGFAGMQTALALARFWDFDLHGDDALEPAAPRPPAHARPPPRPTGASRGIGHATVKRFSAAGWRVITCSRHPFPENCPWEMGPEDHIQVDLADPDRTLSAIADIKQRLENGEQHALVNNAAISPKANGGTRLSSIDTTVDVWDHVFRVNFFA